MFCVYVIIEIMKKFNLKYGFTLIELLVVVAIIAVLSAVVLAFLGGAKDKGGDAAVKANLDTIRGVSELFASDNNNSFLISGADVAGICPSYSPSGTNMLSKNQTIADAIKEATKQGSKVNYCFNSKNTWAVAVGLKTNANTSWCVDSGGKSKQVNSVPSSAIVGGACN